MAPSGSALADPEDIIIEATLVLENCKNYKEVHGMFPGQRDCDRGRKLWNLKQTAAGTKHVLDRPQPQLETLLKEYGVGEEKIGQHIIHVQNGRRCLLG